MPRNENLDWTIVYFDSIYCAQSYILSMGTLVLTLCISRNGINTLRLSFRVLKESLLLCHGI